LSGNGKKEESMPKKHSVLILVLVFAVAARVWAQGEDGASYDGTVFRRFPAALGAYVNYPVGGGLTYQNWFGKAGVEVTLGAFADQAGDYNYNIQGAFQYMVYAEDFANWFSGGLYANVFLAHTGDNDPDNGEGYSPYEYLGLGVGIEMVLLGHLSTSIEFMYVASYPFTIDFGFGGSLKYRF
jgi:hypothetical protein